MSVLQVAPAYGRDYTSKKAILEDWRAGKDFQCTSIMEGGRYINREGAIAAGVTGLLVRYAKQRKVTSIRVDE